MNCYGVSGVNRAKCLSASHLLHLRRQNTPTDLRNLKKFADLSLYPFNLGAHYEHLCEKDTINTRD